MCYEEQSKVEWVSLQAEGKVSDCFKEGGQGRAPSAGDICAENWVE